MTYALLYWILMLIWLIFGLWSGYVPGQPFNIRPFGGNLLLFALLVLIGIKLFGQPVHG